MTRWRRLLWALPLGALGVGLSGAALYAALAFGLARWTGAGPAPVATVEAYVVSNGVHTDLVLPVRGHGVDWTEVFPPADVRGDPGAPDFVAIGWGDREFYLHTPEWRDLTVARALGALSGRGRTLLHVTWLRRDELGSRTWVLPLDGPGHAAVVAHVQRTLAADPQGRAVPVPGHGYGPRDAFYEARGSYDVATTCNTWTGDALREAGVPVGRWTPFDAGVVAHLRRREP